LPQLLFDTLPAQSSYNKRPSNVISSSSGSLGRLQQGQCEDKDKNLQTTEDRNCHDGIRGQ